MILPYHNMNGDDYKTYEEIEANIKRFAKSNELTFNFNKNTSAFRAIIKIIKNIAYWFQSMQISVENNLSRNTCDEVACIRYHGPQKQNSRCKLQLPDQAIPMV